MSKRAATLNVTARSPFHIYYEGPANIVSARNRIGSFDILPGHTDFFSMLKSGDVLIDTEKEEISFSITNGIISVRNGEVELFVNM